ncbi:MAG: AGE family epimerase/isomerase [Reichenbachiella sp.]|uniref:AGE family epimerase/isomerase n=1 Tax=Reichenbachiella sp. TaxID=2184521 RepID=UPI003266DBF9
MRKIKVKMIVDQSIAVFEKEAFEKELKQGILSFWTDHMVDQTHGGYYGRIGYDNRLHENADKGLILNARILWTYATAYDLYKETEYFHQSKMAFNALRDFRDAKHKGVYWMISAEGKPVKTKKQIYAQAFAIYGLAAYYKISHNPLALSWAIELFELIEKHSFDKDRNGYFEAFDREWHLLDDLRLSDKDNNEVKTMNTHLHILEAYTGLYKVWEDERLGERLRNLTELFFDRFLGEDNHFKLFFDEHWNLKSDEISYGHDIEAGWLLHEAALALQDGALIHIAERHAVYVTQATLPYFDQDGGLFNTGVPGEITDKEKHWWPQAEALVGLINAYKISKLPKLKMAAEKCWLFIQDQIIDREHGEWIWGIDAKGNRMKEDKAGPWKCPYHNGRAMMELIKRL